MFAFATLVTNADYALGALALARSLKAVRASAPLIVMATADVEGLEKLAQEGALIRPVDQLEVSQAFRERHSRRSIHTNSPFTKGKKPGFHSPLDNFCKLRLWQFLDYQRIVFLDADTLVVKNIDQLAHYPEFAAAPNLYETLADFHRLNSGVFVACPSTATFDRMLETLDAPGAYWRRTDQTFLQTFFPNWHGLPYTFNVLQYVYFNLPELWHWPSINVVHYQYEKPWQSGHPKADRLAPLIALWHRVLEGGGIPEELPT